MSLELRHCARHIGGKGPQRNFLKIFSEISNHILFAKVGRRATFPTPLLPFTVETWSQPLLPVLSLACNEDTSSQPTEDNSMPMTEDGYLGNNSLS